MNYKIKRGVLKKYKDEKGVTEIFIPCEDTHARYRSGHFRYGFQRL